MSAGEAGSEKSGGCHSYQEPAWQGPKWVVTFYYVDLLGGGEKSVSCFILEFMQRSEW